MPPKIFAHHRPCLWSRNVYVSQRWRRVLMYARNQLRVSWRRRSWLSERDMRTDDRCEEDRYYLLYATHHKRVLLRSLRDPIMVSRYTTGERTRKAQRQNTKGTNFFLYY